MATLEEQRRAIAAGMASSRAATGQAERKATGQSLIERRTGKAVVEDINRLTGPRPQRKTLTPIAPVGALPPTRGRGVYKAPATGTGGGVGLRSPISEVSRSYHPPHLVESSDGLVVFTLRRTNELLMRDADGVDELRVFADVD
ncbi:MULTISPECIES: hypothetical protein [Stutzerimonas stutzeri subgroup]|uniref:Uncharacterized protein n=1 Tax=Stutzerimonas stutzeri CCUG 29243 TaxID=1196835 RepID=I4CRD3_STUST|nr:MULTISPECIES: hypothetical protein [Stutzerimonas stutzeri subgroup]AFM32640.1 hypothetical protein A458_06970 [Stutzerimonas stutzeri CCUG 29243]MCQ2040263.1 hypothetical protein [Stutzerimonas kunmingensis]QSH74592.1 hypothetical protein pAN_18 [Pseudomonas phage vB_PstS-pAN]